MFVNDEREEIYVSVDVETGGPISGVHSLLSLGACLVNDLNRSYYTELRPAANTTCISAALEVTGLDPGALARSGTDPAQAAQEFAEWLNRETGDGRPVFVAFNAPFDWPFVSRLFFEASIENPFGHTALDIKAYYMGIAGCSWNQTRSSQLPDVFAITVDQEHHALWDAIAQARSFRRMLEVRGRMYPERNL